MFWTQKTLPAARDDGLLVERVGDETVVYDSEAKEAHCLSPLAAVVFAHSDGRTPIGEVARRASERLGEPVDEQRVSDAVAQLEERNLMAHGIPRDDGLSRRQMIQRSAAVGAAAVSVPLITSIVPPTALAGASKTCGPFLCCPCSTGSGANANNCCDLSQAGQLQCECTIAEGNSGKFCKPSGTGAQGDAFCSLQTNMRSCQDCVNAAQDAPCFGGAAGGVGCGWATCTGFDPTTHVGTPSGCNCTGAFTPINTCP